MNRVHPTTPLACATCEIEITGRPEYDAGVSFCCAGCVVGGPCSCSYDLPDESHDVDAAAFRISLVRAIPGAPLRPEPVMSGMRRD